MSDNKSVIVEGVMYWPFLTRVNKMADKYTFDLGQLSDDAVQAIKSLGTSSTVRTKEKRSEDDPDRGRFITIKSVYPIRFKDKTKQDVPEEDLSRLGSGTKVKVKLAPYVSKKGHGTFIGMVAGVVLDPVYYEVQDDLFSDEAFIEPDDEVQDLFS